MHASRSRLHSGSRLRFDVGTLWTLERDAHVARCALIWLPHASSARAQFETAAVIGTVRDTSGAVVADVTLTLMSPETGVSVKRTSGPDGAYEFVTVKPGVYVVSAEKPGLAMALVENVQVQVGSRARVDLTMTVGQVAERVEVTAASPLLESENSQRGQVVTGSQIRELR